MNKQEINESIEKENSEIKNLIKHNVDGVL